METKHYLVENLEKFLEYPENVDKFKKYLKDIENIFPIIEEVFGQEWKDDHIYIKLRDSKNDAEYSRSDDTHIITIDFQDDIIQNENHPENLWGCLLHETLHAFMYPIIHRKNDNGKYDNDLDEYYWDNHGEEPFIHAFQAIVYLRLKKNSKTNRDRDVYRDFLGRLQREHQNAQKLYDRYIEMFSENPFYFSKFIKRLNFSNISLFKKDTFWQDLDKAEKALREENL